MQLGRQVRGKSIAWMKFSVYRVTNTGQQGLDVITSFREAHKTFNKRRNRTLDHFLTSADTFSH